MKPLFFVLIAMVCICKAYAQGCSDAGFCSLKYSAGGSKNSVLIGNVSGVADGQTFVNGSYISYARQLSKRLVWDTRFTANYVSGELANNFNAGDVFTNIAINVWKNKTKQNSFTALAGVKIPLTSANDKAGGKPLPMAYQTSLGTYDLLLGSSFMLNKWEFTNAWQIPLTKQNKNTFIEEYSVSNDFPSANKFKRRADVLLRAAYNLKKAGSKFSFKPNLLAVYHLGKDSYEDIYAKRQVLPGSDGLTMNANIIAKYAINKTNSIELSVAAPFVVRDVRPDGLTRAFTVGVEYKITF